MRPRRRPFFPAARAATLLMLAGPAFAAPGSVQDFRLPPAQQEQAERPQGPVAPDVPASREVLRPEPAPTEAPPPPVTAPTTTPPPRIVPPPPAPREATPAATPATRPSPSPTATPAPAETSAAAPEVPEAIEPDPSPAATFTPSPLPSPPATASAGEGGNSLPWIIAALAALAALALGARLWRRRSPSSTTAAPQIERPKPAAPPPAAPAPEPDEPLQLEVEPLRFSLTLMNAALSYRLVLNNRGAKPLQDVRITADMISAHASLSREEQLCGPDAGAMQVASIPLLEPGGSHAISGEFRVPLSQIVPIRQGRAALLLPLIRFRIESAEGEPLTRTFLVAQPPEQPGARLQPFRLDQGPRIYPKLAQRAFA